MDDPSIFSVVNSYQPLRSQEISCFRFQAIRLLFFASADCADTMSETKGLRAQVKEIREAAKQEGSLISGTCCRLLLFVDGLLQKEIQLDDFLNFTLGKTDPENITVCIPENFPRGVYKVI